jgi:ribosomal protection tetracycline resistance protein
VVGRTLNLGILAHVDAGKTTLTERLLHAAGVIDDIGSVDKGTTRTDSLALERQRGITIKSAVVSFELDGVRVNLIDTPGHPDFIAEVERVLCVLDGAVLVVSAVEGVQPQTRVLVRALQRLRIPTVVFVNKVDRVGADVDRVLAELDARVTPTVLAMAHTRAAGSRDAAVVPAVEDDPALRSRLLEAVAEHDNELLRDYVDGEDAVASARLFAALRRQTADASVYPAYCGSALTGAGVEPLTAGIAKFLPASGGAGAAAQPVGGVVFKIERARGGERIAYIRLFTGSVNVRDRVRFGEGAEAKVTGLRVFADGGDAQRTSFDAGEIAKVSGLAGIRIGDAIGEAEPHSPMYHFAPPTLESVVVPAHDGDRHRLALALAELSEQDPLINVRRNDARRELSVSLYGEVQKEVLAATLASDYGVDVCFRETTVVHVERPKGSGQAFEVLKARTKSNVTGKSSPDSSNPFLATLGLRVEPRAAGSGTAFRIDVDVRLLPLYIYGSLDTFADQMHQYVGAALQEGLFGWQVIDCAVTLTDCGYRAPGSAAADFQHLTSMVLMRALAQAGTVVCEPTVRVRLEVPREALGSMTATLAQYGAAVETPALDDELAILETVLPAARARDLERQLPGMTQGEGVFESTFAGYQPVLGEPPAGRRTRPSPLDRDAYRAHVTRHHAGSKHSPTGPT